MAFSLKARRAALSAVCVAALLAAGTLAVRAQDPAPGAADTPVQPAAPAPAEAAPAPAQAAPAPAADAAAAETAVDPAAVVARVGDREITERQVEIARQEFGTELNQVPEAQRRGVVVDALINMELLAQAARDIGLDKGPEFEARLDFLKQQALRNAYVEREIIPSLTSEELQKGYETFVVGEFKPQEEIRARHILVDTKEQAEKIIADLKAGGSFEELAKQSKDPSGQNGGDLGFFGRGQMVPPFEEAAFALEPGKFTETPVQTEFGFHVIKVEEKRTSEPPKLEEVEDELRNFLLRQKFESVMATLRDKYPIEVVQPAPGDAAPASAAPSGEAGDAPAASEPPTSEGPAAAPATGEQPQN
jgi:peptidyl-prolyl cis-trans isomerase C